MDYSIFNSFTAPVCNISGMKNCKNMPAKSTLFWFYSKSNFNFIRFDKLFSQASEKKRNKKNKEFQISYFYWSFSSDVIAMKGLRCVCDLLLVYIHTGDLGL